MSKNKKLFKLQHIGIILFLIGGIIVSPFITKEFLTGLDIIQAMIGTLFAFVGIAILIR